MSFVCVFACLFFRCIERPTPNARTIPSPVAFPSPPPFRVGVSRLRMQESMRRITGILREHVLEAPCSGAQGQTGAGQITPGGGGGEGQGGDRRCWAEPFMVDIRYEKSTEQVHIHVLFHDGCTIEVYPFHLLLGYSRVLPFSQIPVTNTSST